MENIKTLIKFGFVGTILILILSVIFTFIHLSNSLALFLASFVTVLISYKYGKDKFKFSLLQGLFIFIVYSVYTVLSLILFLIFIKWKSIPSLGPIWGATIFLNIIILIVNLVNAFFYIFLGSITVFLLKKIREPKIASKDKLKFGFFLFLIFGIVFVDLLLSFSPFKLIPESEKDCLRIQEWIKNESAVSKCYHNLAVRTKNETYCSKISLTYGFEGEKSQEYCYAAIARVTENHKICEKAFDKIECYAFLARGLNDSSVCNNNLEVENDKNMCVERFIEKSKIRYVGKGLPKVLTEEACEAQTNLGLKSWCYSNLAAEQKNESFCEKIVMTNESETYKDRFFCYIGVAWKKNDTKVCEHSNDKEKCYQEVTAYVKDLKACEIFNGEDIRGIFQMENCLKNFLKDQKTEHLSRNLTESDCTIFDDIHAKNSCFYISAELSSNEIYCEKIVYTNVKKRYPYSLEKRDSCFDMIARVKNDSSICLKAGSYRDNCVDSYVVWTKDLSACSLIIDPSLRERCSNYYK